MRKIFLVAERLAWEKRPVSMPDRDLNEELNWKVNHELGILDPFVEETDRVAGGKRSRQNHFYPYQNEHEMKLALKYIFMADDVTEVTWAFWLATQLDLQRMAGDDDEMTRAPELSTTSLNKIERPRTPELVETIDLTNSPSPPREPSDGKQYGLPTPPFSMPSFCQVSTPSSGADLHPTRPTGNSALGSATTLTAVEPAPFYAKIDRNIKSYKSLQDFYSLLDRIERTSYVAALFLESYVENLRNDMCKNCWLKHNINLDLF
ncbi:hypothetical protein EK21DRAFT_106081 [Setomelanomma holmii]|uniref:Uncharacterized protein n=1 Tax=Setomelanomma holmii TaxID=210430 RepID=A0A9P4HP52_9PLEO|nr:hypothetical protein EK21DRAFT_106081 [Setomelanomma holmii]